MQAIPYRQSFLKQQAQEAWNYFKKTGYPSSRDENWRFSNPTPWLLKSASPATEEEEFTPEEFSAHIIQGAIPILILNDTISIPSELPEGIQIMDMGKTDSEHLMHFPLGSIADFHTSSFSAENMAFFQNGILINISENMVLGKPLQLIHVIKGNIDSRIYPRVYVNIGANSQIEILQTEAGDDDHHHFVNSVVEVIVHENAQLKWTLIQKRNIKTGQISSFNITLKKNSTAIYNTFEFGGGFIRRDIHAHLQSTGGDFEINSLFVPRDKQHMDIFSIVHHESASCSSRQLVKGVMGGNSRGVFRGIAHVYNEANKTDARQTNRNLLLSSQARMNSIPQLEIYANDVKCSHGSTTGQIDEEAVFYLRSRGISRMGAMELMVKGFANEVVDKVENDKLKANIHKVLEENMEGMIS